MRPILVSLAMGMLLLSCSRDQPTSSVSPISPSPILMMTYGRELATPENQAIHFEAYPSQDSISLAFLGEVGNVALRIYEDQLGAYVSFPPKSELNLSVITRRDREDLRGGANLFIRGMGLGGMNTDRTFHFTSIIPARLTTQVTAGDDTLEFCSGADDFLIVSYESPFSRKSIVDTLVIKKDI